MAAKKTTSPSSVSPTYSGLVTCKGIDGSGNEVSRQYDVTDKTEDELFDLFVEHFHTGTHGDVAKSTFSVEAS